MGVGIPGPEMPAHAEPRGLLRDPGTREDPEATVRVSSRRELAGRGRARQVTMPRQNGLPPTRIELE